MWETFSFPDMKLLYLEVRGGPNQPGVRPHLRANGLLRVRLGGRVVNLITTPRNYAELGSNYA